MGLRESDRKRDSVDQTEHFITQSKSPASAHSGSDLLLRRRCSFPVKLLMIFEND